MTWNKNWKLERSRDAGMIKGYKDSGFLLLSRPKECHASMASLRDCSISPGSNLGFCLLRVFKGQGLRLSRLKV